MVYKLIIIFFIFISLNSRGQSICSCKNGTSPLSESDSSINFDCDTINFKNHSVLYRQYNCDSAWLSFQTPKGKRIILFSEHANSDMFELDWKIAPFFVQEYNSVLLFGNQETTAMGWPLNYSLLNKTTGAWEKDLGHLIYYSEKTKPSFVLYLSDSLYNTVVVYLVDKRKRFNIKLPEGRSLANDEIVPEYEFDEPVIKGTAITIKYKYVNKDDKKHWKWGILKFDLA